MRNAFSRENEDNVSIDVSGMRVLQSQDAVVGSIFQDVSLGLRQERIV